MNINRDSMENHLSELAVGDDDNVFVTRQYSDIFGINDVKQNTVHRHVDQFELRQVQPPEVKLLHLVEQGDVKAVSDYIKEVPGLNVNYEGLWRQHMATPLQIAAEQDNIHMIDLLLRYKATLNKHYLSTKDMTRLMNHYKDDYGVNLNFQTLKVYQARSSMAYIAMTSEDPMIEIFKIKQELEERYHKSQIYCFYVKEYKGLRGRVEQFALDLVGCCESLSEVKMLLQGRQLCKSCYGRKSCTDCCSETPHEKWTNLYKAIQTRTKSFVADDKCQQVALMEWERMSDGQSNLQATKPVTLMRFLCCFLQPFIAVICMLWPHCALSKMVFSPSFTCLMHEWSLLTFILLHMYMCSIFLHRLGLLSRGEVLKVDTPITYVLIVYHCLWVAGSILLAIQTMLYTGLKRYWLQITYLTDALWHLSLVGLYIDLILSYYGIVEMFAIRKRYLICATAIISTLYVLKILGGVTFMGKLLITMKKMIPDVLRFIVVFTVLDIMFTQTMYVLYINATSSSSEYSFERTSGRVFWALFGIHDLSTLFISNTSLYGDEFALMANNTTAMNSAPSTWAESSEAIEITGVVMYAFNSIVILLVLLNLFIAMMSDTFTRVQEGIEYDWRFELTCRRICYIDSGIRWNLPPPYNAIAWPWFCLLKSFERLQRNAVYTDSEGLFEKNSEKKMNYDDLMKKLLYKYFQQRDGGTDNSQRTTDDKSVAHNDDRNTFLPEWECPGSVTVI
ncbi:short transient receptor potential channel 5-like [Ptychodera flava]|uniref:short transient receptor potential channel 5-like n=1 Tax=Ptychodera flava TaxID=63121 RepID=UPI00396A3E66